MELARRHGDPQAEDALKHITEEMHGRLDGAKFKLAALYQKGDEAPADAAAAIALYTELAKLDIRQSAFTGSAQFALCRIYGQGQGVTQDYAAARAWCKKAFKNQELPAQGYLFLGSTAELGEGTAVDVKEAAEWYRLAAYGGVPEGAMRLGRLRLAGGSTQGNRDAYFWFSLAAYRKAPGAEAAQQSVAAKLSPKELVDQQKKFNEWMRMKPYDQMVQLKKH